jgi:hypothetical protein
LHLDGNLWQITRLTFGMDRDLSSTIKRSSSKLPLAWEAPNEMTPCQQISSVTSQGQSRCQNHVIRCGPSKMISEHNKRKTSPMNSIHSHYSMISDYKCRPTGVGERKGVVNPKLLFMVLSYENQTCYLLACLLPCNSSPSSMP